MPQTQVSHSVPTCHTTHVNRAAQQRLPWVGTFLQSPIYLFCFGNPQSVPFRRYLLRVPVCSAFRNRQGNTAFRSL